MLGLVLGPGDVLGVGLVVLGVSVPMPPALPPEFDPGLIPEELPLDEPPDMPDPLPDCPLLSEGMDELPEVPPDELSLELVPDAPLLPESEPPPVMPVHAIISIAQATDINHLIMDLSR